MAHLTPEQRTAEKLRLKKVQEEADLIIGLESLGLTTSSKTSIESFNPNTKEEFTEYAEAISKVVSQFKSNAEYASFVDDLVRNLCAGSEWKMENFEFSGLKILSKSEANQSCLQCLRLALEE